MRLPALSVRAAYGTAPHVLRVPIHATVFGAGDLFSISARRMPKRSSCTKLATLRAPQACAARGAHAAATKRMEGPRAPFPTAYRTRITFPVLTLTQTRTPSTSPSFLSTSPDRPLSSPLVPQRSDLRANGVNKATDRRRRTRNGSVAPDGATLMGLSASSSRTARVHRAAAGHALSSRGPRARGPWSVRSNGRTYVLEIRSV